MSTQPSTRKDGFGTAVDEEGDPGVGGHGSAGGTGATKTGGARGNEKGQAKRSGNPANKQDLENFDLGGE